MHHGIVEGEPGIFPDPVARVMRAVGRLFRRGERRPAAPASESPPDAGEAPDRPKREADEPPA